MDYADYPKSIAEHKAVDKRDASEWSPRDALIHLLRAIDEGDVKIESMVITFSEVDEDTKHILNVLCCKDKIEALGMLTYAQNSLLNR